MEKFKVSFVANNQQLTATGTKHASDTYADIEATFVLGNRWTDMDSVSAVWWNDFTKVATVLDSQGKCTVPHEVLMRKGCVRVNLVGSVVENGELVTRLTSYSAEAVHVNEKIKLTGNEPQSITPSQYEQFVENVKTDADRAETAKESAQDASASAQGYAQSASASASSASESATSAEQAKQSAQASAQNAQISAQTAETAKDDAESARDEILGMRATATTLEEGSQATANYSNGVLSLGIPRGDTGATGAKGDKGDTGATPNLTIGNVETLEPTESATATITGTAENPVLNLGIPQGDTGEVSLADLSTLLPTDTASGSIASFPDGQSVIPVVSLIADIEPIQDGTGTPSPDNVRPISGRTEVVTEVCGKNLFDKTTAVDGYIDDVNGQLSGSAPYKSTDYIRVVGGNSYYIVSEQILAMWGAWYDEDKNYISGATSYANQVITAPSNASHVRLTIKSSGTGNVDTFAVNYPSTDHEYHAYTGQTYTTPLGRTVYGGKLDVVSGELVVDRAMVDLGSLNYSYVANGNYFFSSSLYGQKKPGRENILSSAFSISTLTFADMPNGTMKGNVDAGGMYFKLTDYTDASEFKTAMDGVQLVYELAEPQTYQLTPQEVYALLGQNNVWADSGEVEVVYKADVTKWVEKKLN